MDRRSFLAGIAVLSLFFAAPATAGAHKGRTPAASAAAEQGCVINTLPSFIDQGEFAEASSVADIIEVECELTGKLQYDETVTISDVQLYNRCHRHLKWSPGDFFAPTGEQPGTKVELDADGNGTVILFGGPGCKPGETSILVDENSYPFETYTATFSVLPPEKTEEGVYTLPSSAVLSSRFSGAATIVQIEFPEVEAKVAINADQVLARCARGERIFWIGADAQELEKGTGVLEGEDTPITDNDGNLFVVLIASDSCQPGKTVIEASLEAEPFSSVFTTWELLSPKPTI